MDSRKIRFSPSGEPFHWDSDHDCRHIIDSSPNGTGIIVLHELKEEPQEQSPWIFGEPERDE